MTGTTLASMIQVRYRYDTLNKLFVFSRPCAYVKTCNKHLGIFFAISIELLNIYVGLATSGGSTCKPRWS